MESTPPPRKPGLLLVLALVLAAHLPALAMGFFADDHGHQLILRDGLSTETMRPWALYDFGAPPAPGSELWETGSWPWWVAPNWHIRFLRPVTSLGLWLDAKLFGSHAVYHHLSGLFVFLLLLLAARDLYRALGLSERTALLALALFGFEESSAMPVGWIANRNSLYALLFALLACSLALRRGARPGGLLGALLLATLAALSKEWGLVAFPLVALAALRAGAGRGAVLASGACALAYLALLLTQGYGANSRFYPTPWDHPAEWFACLAGMLSIGPVSLATPLPSDLAFTLPELWLPAALGCALVLALCVRPAWRGLRGATGAGFLGAWFLLALLPSTGAPLSDRLLFGASFGSAGLLAIWIERALASGLRGARIGAGVLLVCGLPLAGLANAGRLIELARMSKSCEAVLRDMQLPTSSGGGWRDALILQLPNPLLGINASAARQHITAEPDARLWPLQLGRRALELTREDERTLVLRSLDEPFLHDPIEALFRSWEDELALGRRWDTALFEVEALELEDDGLRALRLRSAKTIDDPSLALLYWNGARLASVPAPAVGETLTLERCQADSVFLP